MIPSRILNIVVFILATANYGLAFGVCIDANGHSDRHPTVKEEINGSVGVVIGEAEKFTNLSEGTSDPEGITATVYRVRVTRLLRGPLAEVIDVRSDNDSGRFPLDLGEKYVLFLQRDSHGYFVDNCGNSGLLLQSAKVLQELGVSADGTK
jgi:hypothetical protein